MTFAALATLAALGDDFESVDIEATSLAIRSLQQEDGRCSQQSHRAPVGNSRNVYTARHLCTYFRASTTAYLSPLIVPDLYGQWKRLLETEPSTYPPIYATLTLHPISFRASHQDSTRDLRFTYCACAISSFLGDWSGIDRAKTVEYIARCFVSHSVFIMFLAG